MARGKFKWFIGWPLSLTVTLYLFLIFVEGNEDPDDAYRTGRNLALEYFLPINSPQMLEVPRGREKRDVEGSGTDETVYSEISEKGVESVSDTDSATQTVLERLTEDEKSISNFTNYEGSGEVENANETIPVELFDEERDNETLAPIIAESNVATTYPTTEVVGEINESSTEASHVAIQENVTVLRPTTTEVNFPLTETILNTTEDIPQEEVHSSEQPTEFTTIGLEHFQTDSPVVSSPGFVDDVETTTEMSSEEGTTLSEEEFAAWLSKESRTESNKPDTTTLEESATTEVQNIPVEVTTVWNEEASTLLVTEQPAIPEQTTHFIQEDTTTAKPDEEHTTVSHIPAAPTFDAASEIIPKASGGLPDEPEQAFTTPEPVVEHIFREAKVAHKTLEAVPGNILQKENLTLGVDPLLIITNTRLMDSEETVQLSSAEPKRLGAYIVIGLILLSFSSLVGYITFRKRMQRKRQEFDSNQECHDTEKALLSLSDYKDNSEMEENHLKNNEITPIVVKSNSQINKFEKNTNFSSPKNLNTIANEKNIEKDNVLKSTAENLTQVIIEDSPKDLEEDKNAPCMERLIVKTRIDQDSIPKKPIIVNRSSTGYMSLPQDGL